MRLLHGNVAFFDTAATQLHQQSNTPSHDTPSIPPKPNKTLTRSCRVRISSDEIESLFGSSPTHDEYVVYKEGNRATSSQEPNFMMMDLFDGPNRYPLTSNNSTFMSSCKNSAGNSTRILSSNKSSETPSTLDSSSFYNRSPSDDVFTSEEAPKLSIGDAPSPSAILTPSTEVSDESENSDDRVFDLRDDIWDITQFDYDLSSLNIDGMSQISGKTPHIDDF